MLPHAALHLHLDCSDHMYYLGCLHYVGCLVYLQHMQYLICVQVGKATK